MTDTRNYEQIQLAALVTGQPASDPAAHAAVVTPSDAADLAHAARALYIGTAGDLKVTTTGGETVAFVGLTAGMILPVAVSKVFATGQAGTIATNIVALW